MERWKATDGRLPGQVMALRRRDAATLEVLEDPLIQRPADTVPAPIRVGADHVDVARGRVVLADERDDEAGQLPAVPRGSRTSR